MAGPITLVVTGPESSGKSTLAKKLARYYKVNYLPEFARSYLEKHGPQYKVAAFKKMLNGQMALQNKAYADASKPLILDTDLVNYAVWAQMVFKQSLEALAPQWPKTTQNHHYLLCYPNLPWQPDPLRENPHNRLEIFKAHEAWLKKLHRPYVVIKGEGEDRFNAALDAANKWLK